MCPHKVNVLKVRTLKINYLLEPSLNRLGEFAAGAVVAVVIGEVVNMQDKYSQHLLRTESVKYPACVVFTKSKARYMHVISLNVQLCHTKDAHDKMGFRYTRTSHVSEAV